jgi:hypothetical protein
MPAQGEEGQTVQHAAAEPWGGSGLSGGDEGGDAGELQNGRGGMILEGLEMNVGKKKKAPDLTDYSGRLANRLRTDRKSVV